MSRSFNKVRRFIERFAMLERATGVLVAVSGGADSVALLDILKHIVSDVKDLQSGAQESGEARSLDIPVEHSGPHCPTHKPHLHVAHLDHMLRGSESAEDAEFVRELAHRWGIESTVRSVDVRAVAEARGRGIEEMARELRYDFLLSAAREAGCDRIAVGHTMTDQAETFLMRLVRGAGLRGLAAMRPVSEALVFCLEADGGGQKAEDRRRKAEGGRQQSESRKQKAESRRQEPENGGQETDGESLPSAFRLPPSVLLLRPLLCITREEVEAYAGERELEFRIDSTNQDVHYTRNRIRNEVVPGLIAINPRIVESIARAAENIAGDQDVLDHLASSIIEKARLTPDGEGTIAYSVTEFLKHPAALRRRLIIEAYRIARAGIDVESDVAGGEITSAHVAAINHLLEPGASGKHVTLTGAVDVWREFESLAFRPRAGAAAGQLGQTIMSATSPAAKVGGFGFTLQRSQPVELLKATLEETQLEAHRVGRDWMIVALDDDALPDSLVIRSRLAGERVQIGGPRQLKLKNLMIDHRIPSSRRANWPIVTTPDGGYVWSPGLPPASKFAAHDGSKRIAIVRASFT